MTEGDHWRALQAGQRIGRLWFIKPVFHDGRYEVYLTNLARIWAEEQDHEGVLRQAEGFRCEIDPGESAQQCQKLFEKLQSCLHEESSTSITVGFGGEDVITLDLTAPLPGGLSDIQWKLTLKEQPPETLRDQLVGPILQTAYQRDQEIEQLKTAIKEKDHVLSRLLDRLESSSTDLTSIFPGTVGLKTSRKEPQRSQLGRFVKGLAPLDLATWQAHIEPLRTASELSSMLATTMSRVSEQFELELDIQDARQDKTAAENEADTTPVQVSGSDTESDDGEFQVQSTPTKGAHNATPKAARREARSPSVSSVHTTQDQTPSKTKKRLGTIGGRARKVSPSPSPVPLSPVAEADASPPPATSSSAPPKKTKLGMIGGRRKEAAQANTPADPLETSDAPSQPKGKGKAVDETIDKVESEPEQTATEAADRRRDELKRQLAAAPATAKKKRKF